MVDCRLFLSSTVGIYNYIFPLNFDLITSWKFGCIVLSFSFIPKYFLTCCVIVFFDPLAFKGVLFSFQIFEYFLSISLLLINSLILLWQEIIL